jgi:hypothetical protein
MVTFGSRNPYITLATFACIVFSIIFTWYHLQLEYRLSANDIINKENVWEITQPNRFSYQISSGCVLSSSFEVFSEYGSYTSKRLVGRQYFTETQTISGLFQTLKKAQSDAAKLSVDFDENYGFPTHIKIDWDSNVADDECFYEVTHFRKL